MSVTQKNTPVVKMTAAADSYGPEYVEYLMWYNKNGNGGDDLLVLDEVGGNEIWREAWPTGGMANLIMPIKAEVSLYIDTLDGGILYVVKGGEVGKVRVL